MMKIGLAILLSLVLLSLRAFGGDMRIVKTKYEADVILYVTQHKYEADLHAKVTDIASQSRQYDHYFRFVRHQTQNVVKVYFTNIKYDADVIVYYGTYNLGWKKSSKFQGRLH